MSRRLASEQTLAVALDELRGKISERDPDYWDRLGDLQDEYLEVVATRPALGVGDRAPDVSALGVEGETVRLSDLYAEGPLILSFYRGGWCTFCNMEIQALQRATPQLDALGARLAVISPMTPEHSGETQTEFDLKFQVLSDAHNEVARAFGIVFQNPAEMLFLEEQNGDGSLELPVPATYVIDSRGIIRYAFVDRLDPTRRPDRGDRRGTPLGRPPADERRVPAPRRFSLRAVSAPQAERRLFTMEGAFLS